MTTMLMIPDSSSNAPNTPDTANHTAVLLLLVSSVTSVMKGLQELLPLKLEKIV